MLELRRRYGSSAGGGQPSRLPAGYQEVEYLESTGTQYIVLPSYSAASYYNTEKDTIVFKIDFSKIPNWSTPLGYYGSTKEGHPELFRFQNSNEVLAVTYGRTRDNVNTTIEVNSIGIKEACFEAGKGFRIEGNYYGYYDAAVVGDDVNTPLLFGYRIIGDISTKGEIRKSPAAIYYYIHYRNNECIINLIPCYRKADNVAGMYDVVNGVFHTNAGTGEFTIGPDVIG